MNLIALAHRIKERRQSLEFTLEQVASRSGLTRSVLSKIENFRVTPSLPALARIAEALETTISELTRGVGEQSAISIVPKGEGVRLERDRPKTRNVYELLTNRGTGSLESLLISIPDAASHEEPTSHEGEECLHVIKGRITLQYGGESFDLSEGDSAHFNASIPHCILNRGEELAQVLCTFGSASKSGFCPSCSSKLFFLDSDPNGSGEVGGYRMAD